MSYFLIDPNEKLDYSVDFSDILDTNVFITGVPTWSVFPLGPTIGNQVDVNTKSTIFLSSTTRGVIYLLTCKATTNAETAQTLERTITVRCGDR